mmetsp:Transcript_18146/g.43236  ORF Transcript_18146/g.43236 Transcript_18146/m.43236 type:complete len:251 (+) Transcript_18146:176-928(+)
MGSWKSQRARQRRVRGESASLMLSEWDILNALRTETRRYRFQRMLKRPASRLGSISTVFPQAAATSVRIRRRLRKPLRGSKRFTYLTTATSHVARPSISRPLFSSSSLLSLPASTTPCEAPDPPPSSFSLVFPVSRKSAIPPPSLCQSPRQGSRAQRHPSCEDLIPGQTGANGKRWLHGGAFEGWAERRGKLELGEGRLVRVGADMRGATLGGFHHILAHQPFSAQIQPRSIISHRGDTLGGSQAFCPRA